MGTTSRIGSTYDLDAPMKTDPQTFYVRWASGGHVLFDKKKCKQRVRTIRDRDPNGLDSDLARLSSRLSNLDPRTRFNRHDVHMRGSIVM